MYLLLRLIANEVGRFVVSGGGISFFVFLNFPIDELFSVDDPKSQATVHFKITSQGRTCNLNL